MKQLTIIILALALINLSFAKASHPIDGLITGKLENGLTYYIYTKGDNGKVKITMQSKVGALVEAKQEHGYAHFLEHMMFNGSKNYPGRTCKQVMESMGMRLGTEITAFTSSTDTEYNLITPANNEEYLHKSLLLLKDWMFHLDMKQEYMDIERNVIKEEINRGGTPASYFLIGTELEGHDVLGDKTAVENVSMEELLGFYKKYYRPDMLAIIIQGEIDEKVALNNIMEVFSDIPKPITEKPDLYPDISGNNAINRSRGLGNMSRSAELSIIARYPEKTITSAADYKSVVAASVFRRIIEKRMNKSHSGSYSSGQWISASMLPTNFIGVKVRANNNSSYNNLLDDVCYTFAQAKEHGFSKEEIDYAVQLQMNWMANYRKAELIDNATIKNSFLKSNIILSGKDRFELYEKYTKKLKSKDFEELIELFLDSNKTILLDSTSASYSPELTNEFIWNKLDSIDLINTEPYEFKKPPARKVRAKNNFNLDEKIAEKPVPELLRKENIDKNLRLLEYGNGVKVVLHQNRKDKISIKIVGNGGLNLIPESDRQLFPMMLRNMENGYAGISDNNTFELERSYGINFSEKIDHYGFLIEMQGNQKNFKEICQILNLRLTSANEMPGEVFQMSFNRMKRLLNTEQDVEYKNYSGQLDLSRIKSGLDTSNVAESASRFAAYRNKIVNKLNNGVIYISGDIPENFEDYITKYIATIPESGNTLSLIEKDFDILANGLVRKQFEWKRGVSVVGYLFTQIPEKITLKEHLIMEGISQFANIRMLQILREKHGLVYSTGINPYTRSYPHNFMSLSIRYMIDSTNIDTSIAIMNEVLGNMSNGIISQNELDRLKAIIQTIYITSYYDDGTINDSWLNMINNFDKAFSRTELLETIESISLKDIQVVMHEILDMENHYILIRRPKWE